MWPRAGHSFSRTSIATRHLGASRLACDKARSPRLGAGGWLVPDAERRQVQIRGDEAWLQIVEPR